MAKVGKPKHIRETAVLWVNLVGASSEAAETAKKGGCNTQRYYI